MRQGHGRDREAPSSVDLRPAINLGRRGRRKEWKYRHRVERSREQHGDEGRA